MKMGKIQMSGLFNDASLKEQVKQFKVQMIHYTDIVMNKDNYYSVNDIDELAFSIKNVGLKQPLDVKPLINGKYELLSGERRLTAILSLIAQGNNSFDFVPCTVTDISKLDLPLSNDLKELWLITTTNSEARDKTDADIMKQIANLTLIYSELKKNGIKLPGKMRDIIADKLDMSPTQVQRFSTIEKKLSPELKEEFKNNKIPLTVAVSAAKLPKETQKRLSSVIEDNGSLTQKDVDNAKNAVCFENEKKPYTISEKDVGYLLIHMENIDDALNRKNVNVSYEDYTDFIKLREKVADNLISMKKIIYRYAVN